MISRRKKLSCGIIGIGWWGNQMLNSILDSERFEVVSVYDTSIFTAETAAKKVGCGVAITSEDLINDPKIDCVFIFSPNDSHVKHAVAAASAKKHIFIEKPIANTLADANIIIQACEKNRVILAVGHNVRHYKIFQKAKKIINKGQIGELIYIEGSRSRPIGTEIDKKSWRFYQKSCNGGPVIQLAIHIIDAVRYISGLDIAEISTISVKRFLKTQNDESFSISAISKSGILMHFFTSYVSSESFYLNFYGTVGSLFIDPFNGLFIQKRNSNLKRRLVCKDNKAETAEIIEFYKSLISGKEYRQPTSEEAADNVRIVEAILESTA